MGWSIAPKLSNKLALDALRMAIHRRRPEPGLLHHSDRGGTYAASEYLVLLQQHGTVRSEPLG